MSRYVYVFHFTTTKLSTNLIHAFTADDFKRTFSQQSVATTMKGLEAFDVLELPEPFAEDLLGFHRYPPAFWLGHMIRYLVHETDVFKQVLESSSTSLGMRSPIVGYIILSFSQLPVRCM